MSYKKVLSIAFIILSLFLMWIGCTLFVKVPSKPKLEQLSSNRINSHDWSDDMDFKGLRRAAEQSIAYFDKIKSESVFHYNDLIYTPDEMKNSINLFLEIIKNARGKNLKKNLSSKFYFFESMNADRDAFFTGYYEPLIDGSIFPRDDLTEPVYETPDDLIEVKLEDFSEEWKNQKIIGRIHGRRLIPYDTREDIVYRNSLNHRASPIAFVNEIELFFLQIQGSGLIRLNDGNVLRVNYAQKNGYPYRSISQILMGKIDPEKMSLQSIKSYLYNNPDEVRDILNYNQSYTFFRLTKDGPFGYIDVPLTPHRSIAMDRVLIPKGGLAYIETEIPVFKNGSVAGLRLVKRFVLVQDTGGAIRDHGRVDLFMGNGEDAELVAGHLKQKGRVFLLVARKEFLH